MYHQGPAVRNNAWSTWMSHGTPGPNVFGSPAVAPSSDGRLELIVVGEDDALWYQWQTVSNSCSSAWYSHWAPPVAGLMGSPVVARGADGPLDQFVISTDTALRHRWQTPNTDFPDGIHVALPLGFRYFLPSPRVRHVRGTSCPNHVAFQLS